jgi:hypothetical protein
LLHVPSRALGQVLLRKLCFVIKGLFALSRVTAIAATATDAAAWLVERWLLLLHRWHWRRLWHLLLALKAL